MLSSIDYVQKLGGERYKRDQSTIIRRGYAPGPQQSL